MFLQNEVRKSMQIRIISLPVTGGITLEVRSDATALVCVVVCPGCVVRGFVSDSVRCCARSGAAET